MDLLDVVLHYDCGLHCRYCTITDDMRQRRGVDGKKVAREIELAARAGCRSVQFTGGEPTMRTDLIPLIRFAASRGYESIKVQTNGLVFASTANLQRAIDAGMNQLAISVHAYRPGSDAYDQETRSGGSEAMMLAAIDNAVSAGLELSVDMIVMRRTLDSLLPAIVDLHERGVETFHLWFVSLTDGNAANVDSMPTMSEAAPSLMACMDFAREKGITVRSLHVPRCILPGYTDHVWHPAVGRDIRVVTPESVFDLSASRLSGGVLPESCSPCIYLAVCPGARVDYVERYGTSELVPVTRAQA